MTTNQRKIQNTYPDMKDPAAGEFTFRPIADILDDLRARHQNADGSSPASDYRIAQVLGVQSAHISTWRRRGTIPEKRLLVYCASYEVSVYDLLMIKTARA